MGDFDKYLQEALSNDEELRKEYEALEKTYEYIESIVYLNNQDNSPCHACPNNPKNDGSGICHCILGNTVIY